MKEINLNVTIDEANLILEGLGHIPFARVFTLVAKLQAQAQQQLNGEFLADPNPESEPPSPTIEE